MNIGIRSRSWNLVLGTLLVFLLPTLSAANTLVVKKVHRADVIEFANGWTTRLTGIRTPDENAPVGREALEFTRRAVEGRRVAVGTLTTDNTHAGIVRDDQGYPFARVFYGEGSGKKTGGRSPHSDTGCVFSEPELNAELLRRGYARVDSQFVFDAMNEYRRLEQEARARGLGVWASR